MQVILFSKKDNLDKSKAAGERKTCYPKGVNGSAPSSQSPFIF